MSTYSGFSQASNISGISSVSCSTSTHGLLRADISVECSGKANLASRYPKTLANTAGKRGNQLEEVNKALSQCEESISEYAIKLLIHECISEASLNMNGELSKSTATKLKQLLMAFDIEKYLHLPNTLSDGNEKITLLGITDLPRIELSYEEKLEVKRAIECKLRKKVKALLLRFEEMGGNLEELKINALTARHQISEVFEGDLFKWKKKIEEECTQYEKDIFEYSKFFSMWLKLKYCNLSDIQLKKAESLLVKVQVSEVQAKITKLNCILTMFKETPMTLEAYQLMNNNLDSKISEMEEEIRNKRAMKKLYDDLKGTEYDQVAQKYSDLCKAIEKKKRIMQNF